jgi:hypothetical protein
VPAGQGFQQHGLSRAAHSDDRGKLPGRDSEGYVTEDLLAAHLQADAVGINPDTAGRGRTAGRAARAGNAGSRLRPAVLTERGSHHQASIWFATSPRHQGRPYTITLTFAWRPLRLPRSPPGAAAVAGVDRGFASIAARRRPAPLP